MRVLQLSKNDTSGGAARAALRLHQGLRRAGHDSRMLVAAKTAADPSITGYERPPGMVTRVRRTVNQLRIDRDFERYRRSRPAGYELFSDDRAAYPLTVAEQIPQADVVNVHWISGFLDYRAFLASVPASTPVLWTLHDLNPLTGGCHYDLGCHRYVERCGRCPQLGSSDDSDLSRDIWQRKHTAFAAVSPERLHIICPSRWLADVVHQSPLLGRFGTTVIPHGLDLDAFSPRPRASARELLGIPPDARVVLFAAENVGNQRKGFTLLVEALRKAAATVPNLLLLSVGRNTPDVQVDVRQLHLGSADNDLFLSMIYSAADLFVTCALQEAFGLTVLESMACGTPVAGFAVGGVADMVRPGVNGLTSVAGDVDGLAQSMATILCDGERRTTMGEAARRIAVEEYSIDQQVRRHVELYTEMTRTR
jgi:glycosyltransferase involved in cell wall biosynthesis